MIQSCTNYLIWTATQGTASANLKTEAELVDSSKVKNKAEKVLMAMNRSIIDLGCSKIATKILLSLAIVVSLVSIVAHLTLWVLGSVLSILKSLEIAWNESIGKAVEQLLFGCVNLIGSPGFAILGTLGSVALQIRTIQQAKTMDLPKEDDNQAV